MTIAALVVGGVAYGAGDGRSFDAGDHYLLDGHPVALRRIAGAVATRVRDRGAGREASGQRLVAPGRSLAGFSLRRDAPGAPLLVFEAPPDAARAADKASSDALLAAVEHDPDVTFVSPLFTGADGSARALVTDEVIVMLRPGADLDQLAAANRDLKFLATRPVAGTADQFVIRLSERSAVRVLELANRLAGDPLLAWAEPNLVFLRVRRSTPNDPRFPNQWHLENTGQTNALPGADANVAAAWDETTGDRCVIIAVLDDGVQVDHPDLAPNIAVNPGEIPGNGIDDDANGYVDDVNGWDFSPTGTCAGNSDPCFNNTDCGVNGPCNGATGGDNNPNPHLPGDNHGTQVAGVAAAAGNNGRDVAGAAYSARILPVRMFTSDSTTSEAAAAAVYYAAGRNRNGVGTWRGADVINMSFGDLMVSATLDGALHYAFTSGRGGKGCPLLAASGNEASGYSGNETSGYAVCRRPVPAGKYTFEWRYSKDANVSDGDDTAWVAYVVLPDGSIERFDAPGVPAGWNVSPGGDPAWTIEDEPAHAYGVGRYQARAGTIGDNGVTRMQSPQIVVPPGGGEIAFRAWVSSEKKWDKLEFFIRDDTTNITTGPFCVMSGTPDDEDPKRHTPVEYPANHPDVTAVGASTDWDYRSDYSNFGAELDIVAPSDGGFAEITTTDRTGAAGDAPGDVASDFGGTSSATPLASGAAALLLSKHYSLTAAEVRQKMQDTAVKIGNVTYTGGFNPFYGYGRLDAAALLDSVDWEPPTCNAHFQCYEVKRGPFENIPGVSLVDQFGSVTADLRRPERLCAPADKNLEQRFTELETEHLLGYKVRHPFVPERNQRIVNQFGMTMVDVVRPAFVAVPSLKDVLGPPPALTGFLTDHFECYKVRRSAGTRFQPLAGVRVDDQFGELVETPREPVMLCAPLNKKGERPGAENHPDHLLCYRTSHSEFPTMEVSVRNQFGLRVVKLIRRMELCVPSLKNPTSTTTTTVTTLTSTTATSTTSSSTTTSVSMTTLPAPARCCDVPVDSDLGNPVAVCFDAIQPDVQTKCDLLGGNVKLGICDPEEESCVPPTPVPPNDFCCECPVSSPPYPHDQVCFDGVTGHEAKCQPPCVLTVGVHCGPVSEECGGSPSGAFLEAGTAVP